MWWCARCADLLQRIVVNATSGPGCFYEQLVLAKHIVADHPEAVPEAHGVDCPLCTHYAKHDDTDLWEEHRVRGVFMPSNAARLMQAARSSALC